MNAVTFRQQQSNCSFAKYWNSDGAYQARSHTITTDLTFCICRSCTHDQSTNCRLHVNMLLSKLHVHSLPSTYGVKCVCQTQPPGRPIGVHATIDIMHCQVPHFITSAGHHGCLVPLNKGFTSNSVIQTWLDASFMRALPYAI